MPIYWKGRNSQRRRRRRRIPLWINVYVEGLAPQGKQPATDSVAVSAAHRLVVTAAGATALSR